MSNTAPIPQVMLPYQSFQPPTVMPPLQNAGGMAWKPPATATVTSGGSSRPNNYYQLPNEQQQAKLNRYLSDARRKKRPFFRCHNRFFRVQREQTNIMMLSGRKQTVDVTGARVQGQGGLHDGTFLGSSRHLAGSSENPIWIYTKTRIFYVQKKKKNCFIFRNFVDESKRLRFHFMK